MENAPDAPIELVAYQAGWPALFSAEAATLSAVLSPWLVGQIEHIGSTAVPGLLAKPIIDMMAPVKSLNASRDAIEAAVNAGWVYYPYKADVMHWFCKPSPAHRTHHLHIVPIHSPLWRDQTGLSRCIAQSTRNRRGVRAPQAESRPEVQPGPGGVHGSKDFIRCTSHRRLESRGRGSRTLRPGVAGTWLGPAHNRLSCRSQASREAHGPNRGPDLGRPTGNGSGGHRRGPQAAVAAATAQFTRAHEVALAPFGTPLRSQSLWPSVPWRCGGASRLSAGSKPCQRLMWIRIFQMLQAYIKNVGARRGRRIF